MGGGLNNMKDIDATVEQIVLKNLEKAAPHFDSSELINKAIDNPAMVTPQIAKKLYSYVKYCQMDNKLDHPVCKDVLKVLSYYERRRKI